MLARIFSCAVIGLEGVVIEVEVDTSRGLPRMIIVGLPDAAVQESRERVQSAIKNSNLIYPRNKCTVNLAPASVRKEGPAFDLPIALGVLVATRQIPHQALEETMAIGELSLDGSVRHVRGILPMTAIARDEGFKNILVPEEDANEAALIPDINVIPVRTLSELYTHLTGVECIPAHQHESPDDIEVVVKTDFQDIKRQEHVKRALEVAAAGSHNVFMLWT